MAASHERAQREADARCHLIDPYSSTPCDGQPNNTGTIPFAVSHYDTTVAASAYPDRPNATVQRGPRFRPGLGELA
jgi:hypothetical protein